MKKLRLIFILFFTILVSSLIAQNYEEVVRPDTSIWYFAHKQLAGWFIDTLFAGEQNEEWINLYYRGEFYNRELTFAGKVKTNESNDKIWYISTTETDSILIFNLQLEKGDIFYFHYMDITGLVDTIFNDDNERKIIEFDLTTDWNSKIQFIEGVGPNISLIYTWDDPGILSPFVVCKFDNEIHQYEVDNPLYFEGCNLKLTSINSFHDDNFKIIPNPFHNYIQFKGNEINGNLYVKLYDIEGRLLINMNISEYFEINTSFLDNGFYILHLMNNDNYANFKMLKQ